MKYSLFNENIKNGVFQSCYLLQGEENFVKERSLQRLISTAVDGLLEWNFSLYDDVMEESAILAAIEALPMMSSYRVVVIKDCPALLSRGGDMPNLLAAIDHIPDTTILVFFMRQKADGKRSLSKILKPYIVEFPTLTDREIAQYLRVDAKQNGYSFAPGAMEHLIFSVGKDMAQLVMEAEKLYLSTPPSGTITTQLVEEVVTKNTTANVFAIMDAAVAGNPKEAMVRLDSLLEEGEAPMAILGAMAYRIRTLLQGKEATEAGLSVTDAQKNIRGPRFVVERALREGRRFSKQQLVVALLAVAEADYGIKSGRVGDRQAVKNALMAGFGS
ncbi:DNA polymerase III subunit delta [Eubacteriales bacterium OttesenSCG-928-M02]|nr:DNA polymerase III subunit delta [Eubacteriales bacterium OttesenSCG-928-M02]